CRHVETPRKCPLTAGFSNASFESLVLRKGTRPISGLSLCGKKSRSWRRKGVVPRSFAYELSLQEALRLKPANPKAGIRAGSDRAAQTATTIRPAHHASWRRRCRAEAALRWRP